MGPRLQCVGSGWAMRHQVETSLRRGWLSLKAEAAWCELGEGEGPSQYNVRGPGQIPAWAPPLA